MTAVLGLTHDEMAIRAATQMRDLAVKGQTPWSRVFGSDIVITSSSDWPEPDFVFSDPSTRITCGFEFKPPGREIALTDLSLLASPYTSGTSVPA